MPDSGFGPSMSIHSPWRGEASRRATAASAPAGSVTVCALAGAARARGLIERTAVVVWQRDVESEAFMQDLRVESGTVAESFRPVYTSVKALACRGQKGRS